jgi:hypothetical protein
MALQPYMITVRPAIRSLDIEASRTSIKSGQSVQFAMTLEVTHDLTVLFDCGTRDTPIKVLHLLRTMDLSPISLGNCTYTSPGEYAPLVSAMNQINLVNQSIRIEVEPPLSPFKVEIEDRHDINQLTLVSIRTLEQVAFEGLFTLTIFDNANEKNRTKVERVQLLPSNNFSEQFYLNVTSYGRQTLHVRGGDYPTIREAQVIFTVGTDITIEPQVYLVNQIAFVNEDFVWLDVQWINGIGFDIEIEFEREKTVLIRYGNIMAAPINRLVNKNDGQGQLRWKRMAKQHLQVGYK